MIGGAASQPAAPERHAPFAWAQVGAPVVEIEAALGALRALDGTEGAEVAWVPPEGACVAGAGAASLLHCSSAAEARAAAESIFEAEAPDVAGSEGPAPRLFTSLAFAAGEPPAAPWEAFGGGVLLLPRWRYLRDGERAWLALALPRNEANLDGAMPSELLRRGLDVFTDALHSARAPAKAPALLEREELPRERWRALVGEILDGIGDRRFDKVVAARRTALRFTGTIDSLDVLLRLRDAAEGCARFLLRVGDSTFLGATPERLVARRGDHVETEALAGSIARGPGGAGDGEAALLASTKDRIEHELVVREVARRLHPLCAVLEVPAVPSVRSLRHLLHLRTPIAGTLRAPTHLLELAAALHPTPAVCGVPTAAARRWIVEREGAGRGLYAGPIGWVDARGDGELRVALRSAVIAGERAWLWVGAGIVTGSEAEREYDETAVKQRAMLAALGVGE